MINRKVLKSQKSHTSKSMGPGVRQVIPSTIGYLDPFVFLDHFGPVEKKPGGQGVPPHPHAGIATITYLFSGSNRHQDSYGHDAVIRAGDLAWMQAGKGIVHSEGMNEDIKQPEIVHGLQFWISLPAKEKFTEPDFFHYPSEMLPNFKVGNTEIKVLCGELYGHKSPVKSLSPAFIYEVKIPAKERVEIYIKPEDSAGIYLVNGSLNADDFILSDQSLTSFDSNGEQITITALEDSHFIVLGGKPLNEPIIGYASYVMNSDEQIKQVMNDYQQGKMGKI